MAPMPDDTLAIPDSLRLNTLKRSVGPAVDYEAVNRRMVLAKIPRYTDGMRYISLMQSVISDASTAWLRYAAATTEAYAQAWGKQKTALEDTKRKIEARSKRDEALATFALNLLTVGVGGPLAVASVKMAVKGLGGSDKFVEHAVKLVEEKSEEPIKTVTEWSYKKLGGEVSGDPFEPAAVSPTEFGAHLNQAVLYQTGTMTHLLAKLQMAGDVSLAGAKALAELIVPTPFIQDAPSLDITAGALLPNSLFALWLAWLWGRDADYWRLHGVINLGCYHGAYQEERVDFAPILKSMLSVHIPESVAIQRESVSGLVGSSHTENLINMNSLLEWANSTQWCSLMYQRLKTNDLWAGRLPEQMAMIKMKRATSWLNAGGE